MDMIMSPWIDGLETYKSYLLVKRLDHGIVLNRSVKILHLAALKDREN
jgi:hypothetical protein